MELWNQLSALVDKWYGHPEHQLEVHYITGLLFCIVAGFIIGSEREKAGKPAGISTHTLVLIGAMLLTTMSQLPNSTPTVAAYIVSGIGFLGAGVIMKNESNKISNLTTAAGVWVSAAVGMAVGYKLYFIAFVTIVAASIGLHMVPHAKKKNLKENNNDSQDSNSK